MSVPISRGKILIVEDNKNWRRRLKKILDQAFYRTIEADSHVRAIELLEMSDDFDLVVTDLHLDKNTFAKDHYRGWEVLETIQHLSQRKVIQTIILTGFADIYLDLRDKKKLRATYFMQKQKFDPVVFLEIVAKALDPNRFNSVQ